MKVVRKLAVNFNGISMAYLMGLVNSLFAVLIAFGVPIKDQQEAAIVTFVNASMVVVAHLGHRLGEAANGAKSPTAGPAAPAPQPTHEPVSGPQAGTTAAAPSAAREATPAPAPPQASPSSPGG